MTHAILTTMTAPFRVTASGVVVLNALGESVARASYNMESPKGTGARIAAALNYCQDLTDAQLTEDSAGTVIEDRDRLLAALRTAVTALKYWQLMGASAEVSVSDRAIELTAEAIGGR